MTRERAILKIRANAAMLLGSVIYLGLFISYWISSDRWYVKFCPIAIVTTPGILYVAWTYRKIMANVRMEFSSTDDERSGG